MKVRDYLVLEKITRSEIDAILKNQNLQIGAEFEFVIPKFVEKYKEKVDAYELARGYEHQLSEYEREHEEWEESLEDDIPLEPPIPPEWAVELGYVPGDDIPDVSDIFPELTTEVKYTFKKMINEFIPLDKLPFNNYTITSDEKARNSKKWIIKPDGSLGIAGVEIVTPVLSITEFIKVCPKMFEFIDKYGIIDNDCGFHISMSIKNVKNLGEQLDIVKLSLFTDEGYIYKYFDMRKYNEYARSAHSTVRTNMGSSDFKEYVKTKKMEIDYSDSHNMAINIEHLYTNNEYIEFRYLGGKDYHRKWNRIKSVIAQYGHNLILACDPEYKKKEYLLKLHNVLLKADLFSDMINITQLDKNSEEYQKAFKRITLLNKRIKLSTDEIADFAHNVGSDVLKKMDDRLF